MTARGMAQLEAMRRKVAALGSLVLSNEAALARAVELEIAAQIARGEGPDGVPWPRTAEGEKPLRGALGAVRVHVERGTLVVVVVVEGVEARHHYGAVRGGVRRPIIPTRSIPDPVARALERVLVDAFERVTRGGAT